MRKLGIVIVIFILGIIANNIYLKLQLDAESKLKQVSPGQIIKDEAVPMRIPFISDRQKTYKDQVLPDKDIEFPEEFFFGTASSSFQTTGGNGLSDWSKHIRMQEPPFIGPGQATDFLNRYREDFDLAESIGDQMNRLSLEWPRIEPQEGKWDKDAVKKYVEIFRYMRSHGIEPMICLSHFDMPLWLIGGWSNPKAPYYYARYADFVARNIGVPAKVKWWLTYNEPQVILTVSFQKGDWPPYMSVKNMGDYEGTQRLLKVTALMAEGHRKSYEAIHKVMEKHKIKPMVSYASAPGTFAPYDAGSESDKLAYNFMSTSGRLFDYFIGSDRDFIGLNHYSRFRLKAHPLILKIGWIKDCEDDSPREMSCYYPDSLKDLILQYKDDGLPIVITENGTNDGEDSFRSEFLIRHLIAVHQAMEEGAPVIGYMYWALTDTWEWSGVRTHYGLISIDFEKDLKRMARPSAFLYREIIKSHKITPEMIKNHLK